MVELVDTPDLKSCAHLGVRVQVPLRVQSSDKVGLSFFYLNLYVRASTLREIKASALVLGFSFKWMATVYIIYSKNIDKFYVGSCLNLVERLEQHNTHVFQVGFTHRASDWEVYYSKEIDSQDLARKIESHIKRMRSRSYYENLKKYPSIIEKLILKYS